MRRSVLLLIVAIVSIILFEGSYAWWNSSWQYRKPITVSEQSGNDLTDFQVKVVVNTSALISEGKMNSDCSDIRFTWLNETSGNEQEIPYWIESGCNTSETIIWVKVPKIPANDNATIYMYYGNPNATFEGIANNGTATFEIFDTWDDGDYNGWTVESGTWSAANGFLQETTGDGHIYKDDYNHTSFGLYGRVDMYATDDYGAATLIEVQKRGESGSFYAIIIHPGEGNLYIYERNEGTWVDNAYVACGLAKNTWYTVEFWDYGNGKIIAKIPSISGCEVTYTATNVYTWGEFGFRSHDFVSSSPDIRFDNLILAKFADPEPTTTIGNEETTETVTLEPTLLKIFSTQVILKAKATKQVTPAPYTISFNYPIKALRKVLENLEDITSHCSYSETSLSCSREYSSSEEITWEAEIEPNITINHVKYYDSATLTYQHNITLNVPQALNNITIYIDTSNFDYWNQRTNVTVMLNNQTIPPSKLKFGSIYIYEASLDAGENTITVTYQVSQRQVFPSRYTPIIRYTEEQEQRAKEIREKETGKPIVIPPSKPEEHSIVSRVIDSIIEFIRSILSILGL